MPFQLWRTIRYSNRTWLASFENVNNLNPNPPTFEDVGCGSATGQDVQVVCVGTDGNLWHTINTGAWQGAFIQVPGSQGPAEFLQVACAGTPAGADAGYLHVVGVGSDGQLWHTFRYPPTPSWQTFFGLIESQSQQGPPDFIDVGCGSAEGIDLQVVGVGSDGQLWHTIRFGAGGGWQGTFDAVGSTGGPKNFRRVACAGTVGVGNPPTPLLHVVGVGSDGQLWHTSRDSSGNWQAAFDLIESHSAGGPPSFVDVGCGSADGVSLQIVGVGSDGQLWHTINNPWQTTFGLIESQTTGGPPGFWRTASAGANQSLQVVGIG